MSLEIAYLRAARYDLAREPEARLALAEAGYDADHVAWLVRCGRQSVEEFSAECRDAHRRERTAQMLDAWGEAA